MAEATQKTVSPREARVAALSQPKIAGSSAAAPSAAAAAAPAVSAPAVAVPATASDVAAQSHHRSSGISNVFPPESREDKLFHAWVVALVAGVCTGVVCLIVYLT